MKKKQRTIIHFFFNSSKSEAELSHSKDKGAQLQLKHNEVQQSGTSSAEDPVRIDEEQQPNSPHVS